MRGWQVLAIIFGIIVVAVGIISVIAGINSAVDKVSFWDALKNLFTSSNAMINMKKWE